jgi:hypothetical protein
MAVETHVKIDTPFPLCSGLPNSKNAPTSGPVFTPGGPQTLNNKSTSEIVALQKGLDGWKEKYNTLESLLQSEHPTPTASAQEIRKLQQNQLRL